MAPGKSTLPVSAATLGRLVVENKNGNANARVLCQAFAHPYVAQFP